MLLSTINWTNRVVSDNFGIYGANAGTARTIVDRAIADWERVIVNFNYTGGGNTYNLNVTANPISGRGSTGSITRNDAVQKKPTSAAITLDDNGQGGGWYFDTVIGTSTVPDDGEFTTFLNAFAAQNATADNDFYRTIVHEIGHAMGILDSTGFLRIGDFLTNGGADPNNGAETLRLLNFNGGAVDYTLTTDGGGHLFEGGGAYAGPVHPFDLMNDGRTVPLSTNIRELISDTDAQLLADVYGYTITLPSTINTFYANLNTTTNVVTVTGDIGGDTTDIIDLELTGTNIGDLRVEANGTSEIFPDAEYTAITVNALTDVDDVDVDELESSKTVTINLGDGNDRCDVAQEAGDVDTNLGSNLTINGGVGTDIIDFHDTTDAVGGDDWTFTTSTVTKNAAFINRITTYATIEQIIVNGSAQPTTYDINSLSNLLTTGLTINAGAANDTITLGGTVGDIDSNVFAPVVMNGGGGTDALIFNDSTDDASVADSYTLTSTTFDKSSTSDSFTFATVEDVTLTAGLASNAITVNDFTGGGLLSLSISGNDGNDSVALGGGDLDSNLAFVPVIVNGNAGTDSLYLNDLTDTGPDSYTFTTSTFDKNTAGLDLITFLSTETVSFDANPESNTIDIQGVSSIVSLTANGNNGDDTFNLGISAGNAEQLNGPLTINGNAGNDAWNYLDSTNSFNNTYTLTSTTVTRTSNGVVTFGTIENATLLIGPGAAGGGQIVNAQSFAGTFGGTQSLTITGNTGNDTFNMGSGDLESDFAFMPVTVTDAAGTDTMNLNDATDGEGNDGYTFTAITFDKTTIGLNLITFTGVDGVKLDASPFNNTININAIASGVSLTVNGNAGNDTFNVGNGDMDSNFFGGTLAIDGGVNTDSVVFDDATDGAGVDNYTIAATSLDKPNFSAPISYLNFEIQRLEASPNADSIVMNSSFPDWRINGNAGADAIDVVGNQAGSVVTVDGGAGLDTVTVNNDAVGVAAIQFVNTQDLAALSISTGGSAVVTAGANKVLNTQALTITGSGTLDLTDNAAIIDYLAGSPIASIQAMLTTGYAAANWNGVGINSSTAAANVGDHTALGYGEASEIFSSFPAPFRGQNVDNTSVLIAYAFYGDANLDKKVDLTDFTVLAANFNGAGRRWNRGNFNYDGAGTVDLTDFTLLAANFNSMLPAAAAPPVSTFSESSLKEDVLG